MPVNDMQSLGIRRSESGRAIDAKWAEIRREKLTECFWFTEKDMGPTARGDRIIQSHFQHGLLHCTTGPAWTDWNGPDSLLVAWAMNGEILAIDKDGDKHILNYHTSCMEQFFGAFDFTRWTGLNVRKDGNYPDRGNKTNNINRKDFGTPSL